MKERGGEGRERESAKGEGGGEEGGGGECLHGTEWHGTAYGTRTTAELLNFPVVWCAGAIACDGILHVDVGEAVHVPVRAQNTGHRTQDKCHV